MKIAHVTNYAPGLSGMYGTVKELLLEERKRGLKAEIIDDSNGYNILANRRDEIVPVNSIFGEESDIICWHHAMFQDWFNEPHRNLVLFLHGTPEFNFFSEIIDPDDRTLSLIIGLANMKIPRRMITMWERHVPFWENLLQMPVDFVPVWANLDNFKPSKLKTKKDKIRIAMVDFWRITREPFGLFAALDYLRKHTDKQIEINVWGGAIENLSDTYKAIIQWMVEDNVLNIKGKTTDPHKDIYTKNDLVLTMSTEETRVVREAYSSGIPVVCGRSHLNFTDYCCDCIEPRLLAETIDRCHNDLIENTKSIRKKLRGYAEKNFDVENSIDKVISIFEEVIDQYGSVNQPKIIQSGGVRMVSSIDDTIKKLEDRFDQNLPTAFVRFGDGELLLMEGYENEGLHENSKELQDELIEAFTYKEDGFMTASLVGMVNEKHMRRSVFATFDYDDKLIKIVEKYRSGETLDNGIALHYMSVFESPWFISFLRKILFDKKVLFIGNYRVEESILMQRMFNISTIIGFPETDAYKSLDANMQTIEYNANQHDIIIAAAGPTSKVIAKRLWKKGIKKSFIDIGSIADALLDLPRRGWIRTIGDTYKSTYEQEFIGGKTDIIVLSYKQEEKTISCFKSIAENTKNYRVIWVDNGSGEESIQKVMPFAQLLEECEIIKSVENLGYSKGVNLGIRKILNENEKNKSDYILFLNNDVVVPKFWLNHLKLAMTCNNVDVIGPLTSENNPHSVENLRVIETDLPKFDNEDTNERSDILWKQKKWNVLIVDNMLSFFCCLFKKEVIEQTGLLDENLFAYGEDNDYCERMRRCNKKLGIATGCYVHHDHSITSKSFGSTWIEERKKEASEYLKKKYS